MTPAASQTATPMASDADAPTSIATERVENATNAFETQVVAAREWFAQSRFDGIGRLHTAREVAVQQGTIQPDYTIARTAAEAFHSRLRELFSRGEQITTFGPYSPGQAVVMKRMGIEAIYLGGWATSAKGSKTEDPGPDLASYPLGQVPDEAAGLVRALLAADKNQHFARARMNDKQRRATTEVDFRPFIIADADTGHGGDAHVRNLVRRFVEIGVPGYHIEDQKPGAKKCGHQGGKVLVAQDEQNKRLNAARLQLDVMRVPGIIVARTDAESATFLDNRSDERDQPFILGATNLELPSYRVGFLAILKTLHDHGLDEIRGHLLYAVPEDDSRKAAAWLVQVGLMPLIERNAQAVREAEVGTPTEELLDAIDTRYAELWQAEAGLKTYGEGGRGDPRTPDSRWRGLRHHARGVARLREPCVLHRGPRQGGLARHPSHLGSRASQDAGRLLPGPGRDRLRDRQVPCGRAVRRPAVDGDEDSGPRGRATIRGGDPCRVSRQDAGLQPLAIVQLGHYRAE